jgi:thiamine-phosphate pyrophosphorylase
MTKLYLISPEKIEIERFFKELEEILKKFSIKIFQLRLKNISDEEITKNAEILIKICHKYQTKFILNDRIDLALKVKADGVHVGKEDKIPKRSQVPKDFILGLSCYDQESRVQLAQNNEFDYAALGAFYPTKTKKNTARPTFEFLDYCQKKFQIPLAVIGGINHHNIYNFTKRKVDYICFVSCVWSCPDGSMAGMELITKPLKLAI